MGELRAAGCVFAEDEAALLLEAAGDSGALEALVARRVAGEPLEQILGWAEFCGLRIRVGPGIFVPRRRTELLVELTLSALDGAQLEGLRPDDVELGGAGPVVVDLCCGSGAIGAAVLAERADVALYAVDLEPAAVHWARINLPAARAVLLGDLFAPLPADLRGRVQVVAANAPYVPSDAVRLMPPEARDHEPRTALDGGPDGLDLQRRIAAGAGDWLAPGGRLLIETSERQARVSAEIFAAGGLHAQIRRSEDLDACAVVGLRPGGARP